MLCLALALLAAPALAQDAITFVDVPLEETFVITLPDDWPVWVQSDYASFDEADSAAVDLFNQLYPDANLTTPYVNPDIKLLAAMPNSPADATVRLGIEMLSLSEIAGQADVDPEAVSVDALAEALGGDVAATTRLNDRPIAFSMVPFNGQILFSATSVFQQADRIAVVSLTAPADFFDSQQALVTFLLSTLRLDGEPIPGAAFLELTGGELPDDWTLPDEAEIVYVEATPEPIVCMLNATQNVNLRGGAGTGFPVQGSLAAGSRTSATGQTRSADGFIWFQVESGAWVRADVIVEDASCVDLPLVAAP